MMECNRCGHIMEYYDHFDEEYQRETISLRWRFHCPYCNHYAIALVTYVANKIEMEWE